MENLKFNPGDVVATNFEFYQHFAIVSDKVCKDGKPMLISATKRNGTVQEESWDTTTRNKPTYVVEKNSTKEVANILRDARSMINKWDYSLVNKNCEHFVNWALGLKMESIQVNNFVIAGLFGLTFASAIKYPKITTAFLVAGTALNFTKAPKK